MRRSHTIIVQIDRPFDAVYDFLSDPLNFTQWAAVDASTYRQLDNGDWAASTPFGDRTFRFCEHNDMGVLDHAVVAEGEIPLVTPMRVIRNGDGCEVMFTFFQRDGMNDDQFVSSIEWITADFWALKSVLEAT